MENFIFYAFMQWEINNVDERKTHYIMTICFEFF